MELGRTIKACAVLAIIAAMAGCATPASAPSKGSRTTLQHVAYPNGYEVNVIRIVLPANANSPHHTHPGLESGYVVRGSVTVAIDGQPEHVLHAGDTFETPANAPHIVKNGPQETEIVSTYITEVGKPLTQVIQ
ncbi:MAG: cupin domain-containing protein [Janthinobacterium lividum]|uniref:cupin domain-containing protein n=1 Tax=Pseudomonas baltica TaxID=2762576 RepID=UPI00289D74F6|nr:cupin domain-containing protein [Pseudomonas baltica]